MKKTLALLMLSAPLLAAPVHGQEQSWTLNLGRFEPSFESRARPMQGSIPSSRAGAPTPKRRNPAGAASLQRP